MSFPSITLQTGLAYTTCCFSAARAPQRANAKTHERHGRVPLPTQRRERANERPGAPHAPAATLAAADRGATKVMAFSRSALASRCGRREGTSRAEASRKPPAPRKPPRPKLTTDNQVVSSYTPSKYLNHCLGRGRERGEVQFHDVPVMNERVSVERRAPF